MVKTPSTREGLRCLQPLAEWDLALAEFNLPWENLATQRNSPR